jgi:acyl-CoA synthetase (AMP-forming)/AMP-acid ligase II
LTNRSSPNKNISSVEVEGALLRHPAVQEVAIVGMPDERWGEAPHAFVVLKGAGHFQTVTNSDLRLQTSNSSTTKSKNVAFVLRHSFVIRPSPFVIRHSKHVLRGKPAISKQ